MPAFYRKLWRAKLVRSVVLVDRAIEREPPAASELKKLLRIAIGTARDDTIKAVEGLFRCHLLFTRAVGRMY